MSWTELPASVCRTSVLTRVVGAAGSMPVTGVAAFGSAGSGSAKTSCGRPMIVVPLRDTTIIPGTNPS